MFDLQTVVSHFLHPPCHLFLDCRKLRAKEELSDPLLLWNDHYAYNLTIFWVSEPPQNTSYYKLQKTIQHVAVENWRATPDRIILSHSATAEISRSARAWVAHHFLKRRSFRHRQDLRVFLIFFSQSSTFLQLCILCRSKVMNKNISCLRLFSSKTLCVLENYPPAFLISKNWSRNLKNSLPHS